MGDQEHIRHTGKLEKKLQPGTFCFSAAAAMAAASASLLK